MKDIHVTSFLAVFPCGDTLSVSDTGYTQTLTVEDGMFEYPYTPAECCYFPVGVLPMLEVLANPAWTEDELTAAFDAMEEKANNQD